MAAPVGGCNRIARQTHPLIPTLFAQSGGDGRVCVAGSEPMPEGIALPTHMHSQITNQVAHLCATSLARTGSAA